MRAVSARPRVYASLGLEGEAHAVHVANPLVAVVRCLDSQCRKKDLPHPSQEKIAIDAAKMATAIIHAGVEGPHSGQTPSDDGMVAQLSDHISYGLPRLTKANECGESRKYRKEVLAGPKHSLSWQ